MYSRTFLPKAIYLKACFEETAESDLSGHFPVTFRHLSGLFVKIRLV